MSGDTAVPLPEHPRKQGALGNYATSELTPEQMQRAAALEVARDALKTAGKIFASDTVSSWTVGDLLTVADWVLEGRQVQRIDAPSLADEPASS